MDSKELSERLLNFAVNIYFFSKKLKVDFIDQKILQQLVNSSSSAGANYQEACAAESKADFIHKMQIVLKELRESKYWLVFIERVEIGKNEVLSPLIIESDELIKIIARSVITAKHQKTR
ncbi:MAG: four helix bundle protein [Bacteroidetes bacterium]|nr:four helix bundle protein [Bacteroidota bacterium]MBU2585015.1 four helix bundle protein [Bacteroidota bacterium]